MFEAILSATSIIAQPSVFLYMVLGAFVGYLVGFLPGLTGSVGMALLLPLTYGMDPYMAFAMLAGVMGSSSIGGAIPASISEGSLLNGLLAGCFGLLLSFHGANSVTGGVRYAFNSTYLWDGIDFLPVLMGLFAVTEMISLVTENQTISERGDLSKGSMFAGVIQTIRHWRVVIQSSLIGVFVGAIPGVGGTVANYCFASISEAQKKCKEIIPIVNL